MKTRQAIAVLWFVLTGYAVGAGAIEPSAVLLQPQGQVFVGQATTMVPGRHSMPLYTGNRVVVTANSGGTVVYADGCTISLPANSLLAIGGSDQCQTGQAVAHAVGGFQDPRIGQAGPLKSSRKPTATIRQISGTGTVDQLRAVRGMRLYKSNKITAGANSRIVVRYSNNCEDVVEAGKSLVIRNQPSCKPRRIQPDESTYTVQETEVESVTGGGPTTGATASVGAATSASTSTASLLVPAAILTSIGGVIALSTDHNNSPPAPASPE